MIEVRLAEEHVNRQMATEGIIVQTAAMSLFSKEGGKAFKQLIKGLTDGSE